MPKNDTSPEVRALAVIIVGFALIAAFARIVFSPSVQHLLAAMIAPTVHDIFYPKPANR